MIRHEWLMDPVERTADMDKTAFTKYVNINQSGGQVDPEIINIIKEGFFSKHSSYKKFSLNAVWDWVEPKLKQNPGLAHFAFDYDGDGSDYFFPWLMNIAKSPSAALEMAYGAGEDLNGDWIKEISYDDPIYFFVRNDPTFVYNRERQLFVADLVASVYDNNEIENMIDKIVDFGAGRLAWARWHGLKEYIGWEHPDNSVSIKAFDKDSSINVVELLDDLATPSVLNVEFNAGDLFSKLNDPACEDADLIILGGVASYIPTEVFDQLVIPAVYRLLAENGTFFFDLQLDCPYLQRSMSIFDWPKLILPANPAAVIERIERTRKALWQQGQKFSVEYAFDTYNEFPSAIMITMQKQ